MLQLVRSTHPGPALAVTAVTIVLGISSGLAPWQVAVLGASMLFNQFSVGLSNDWIDADRDAAAGRLDKPVALGLVSRSTARAAAFASVALSLLLAAVLGPLTLLLQFVFIASAWAYNLGLKSTVISVLPYILSFGLLPSIASSTFEVPLFVAGAALGVAAHFANVLPDLADDAATGVRGLPHRVGRRATGVVVAGALAVASVALMFVGSVGVIQWVGLAVSLVLAVATAVLVVAFPPTRWVFRLIIAAAIVDVVLLALSA
jgi:4-hydroxybenzoate polyprenyltransferase